MLVFASIFQGAKAESIEDFIKPKLQTKLKDAKFIIHGSFVFLIYLFQDDTCLKFGGVIFLFFYLGSEISVTLFLVFLVFLIFLL